MRVRTIYLLARGNGQAQVEIFNPRPKVSPWCLVHGRVPRSVQMVAPWADARASVNPAATVDGASTRREPSMMTSAKRERIFARASGSPSAANVARAATDVARRVAENFDVLATVARAVVRSHERIVRLDLPAGQMLPVLKRSAKPKNNC